jgi:hypothetical protein
MSVGVISQAAPTMLTPWAEYHRRWRELRPPQRPHADVVSRVRSLLTGHGSSVLLLGVTPELTDIGASTFALDSSAGAVAAIWPGDTLTRRAVRGEWQHVPAPAGAFSAAIGDGSLNCVEFPCDYVRVLSELARSVRIGGRIVIRVYVTPGVCESLAEVRAAVMAGAVGSVHALKWRMAMALCAERDDANIAVRDIPRTFNALFPSRREVMAATRWGEATLAQIDVYDGLPEVYSFPTREQIAATLPADRVRASWEASGSYELADRCPLLVLDVIGSAGVG